MDNRIKSNFVYNLIYKVVLILIPLIAIPYVARVLLDEGVGEASYNSSIVTYFMLFASLGSETYANKLIGEAQDRIYDRSKIFWEIFIIRLISSVILFGLYYAYVVFFAKNKLIAIIFSLNLVNVVLDISWFFQGIEKFKVPSMSNIIFKVLYLVAILLFVKTVDDVWIYVLIHCVSILFSSIFLWLFVFENIKKPQEKIQPFKHVKGILFLFVPTIATQVYCTLDKSMIGWYTVTSSENGYYEYAENIVRMITTVITALSAVILPRIANFFKKNDWDGIRNIIYSAVDYCWIIGIPMVVGIIEVADLLIPLYLGNAFLKSALLVKIFAPIIVFVGLASLLGVSFLIPIDKQWVNVVSVVIASVVNFCLNLVLIPKYFSVGAAIASVTAEFLGIFLQLLYIFVKKLLSVKIFLLSSIKKLIASAIMFAILFSMKKFLLTDVNWINLIALISCGLCVYFISLILLRDKNMIKFFGRLRKNFSKKGNN